jgi:UDP-glucose 4-epimerase
MRMLVTGAAGFIGSTLVDRLLAEGHEVTGVDNLSTGRLANLEQAASGALAFAFVECDVTGPVLGEVLGDVRPDAVFHLAAQADVRLSVADPLHDARNNVLGTVNVMEASRRAGVRRVVYAASGGSLYGAPARLPVSEDGTVDPLSPYAAAKASGELYLHAFAGMYGLVPVSLALANVYGPRQDPFGEAGVVGIFGTAMLEGRPTIIYGDGGATRDFVYVDDVVEAFVRAGHGRMRGRRFNIGTGTGTTVAALHGLVAEVVGVPDSPVHAPARTGEVDAIVLDGGAARRGLGWAPQVGLREGIRRTVDWLRGLVAAPTS